MSTTNAPIVTTQSVKATPEQLRSVHFQFVDLFADLTASEASQILNCFAGIFERRQARPIWKHIHFIPADSDHCQFVVPVKKGGVR